jgi:hypothetical protein
MMFAGDKLTELPQERMRLLQQALPVCDVRPLDLFPSFTLKPIWDLKIRRPFGAWDVVALFNWTDAAETLTVSFAELGLTAADAYLVYDFWPDRFLGCFRDAVQVALAPRTSRLLAVHRAAARPQFLSTDRHITQGGVSLLDLSWDETTGVLQGRTELVAKHRVQLAFYVPPGYAYRDHAAPAVDACAVEIGDDGALRLLLEHAQSGAVDWSLVFGPGAS